FGWNSCTGLVSRIQVVSERFDDPISRDADMGRALVDHSPDGIHNGASRPNLPAFRIFDRWNNKEMAEQFVCAVDQVNIHPFNYKVDLLQSCFSKAQETQDLVLLGFIQSKKHGRKTSLRTSNSQVAR